jgi:hypothetical protein
MDFEDTGWDQLNPGIWKGIGLTDPIKNVEVSNQTGFLARLMPLYLGQMAASSSFFKGQRVGQAAY